MEERDANFHRMEVRREKEETKKASAERHAKEIDLGRKRRRRSEKKKGENKKKRGKN